MRLTVDLTALGRNWKKLAAMAEGAECAGVVKADAYGLGIDRVVPALSAAGCRTFFVALPEEGVRVREFAPDAAIYVLCGFLSDLVVHYSEAKLRPVLGFRDEVEAWAGSMPGAPSALHVDTGMNRLGVTLEEAEALSADPLIERAGVELVISHLACADEPEHPLTARQRARFSEMRELFPGKRLSLANSAGVHLGPHYHYDLVRPGIAVYGGASHPFAEMETVVTAEARVLQVRDVPAGEAVGYGAVQTVHRDSRIAVLGAGYADGYQRAASAVGPRNARVRIGNHIAPLLGRVSMDLMAIDVTDLPEEEVRPGVWAELFGPHVAVDSVAAAAGTIGYELLTGLSRRATRIYRDETSG
ncbi:alanine racemase [Faunimonas pinastri]|uniref:alanine racemase n=1 Tax=Faunimonas pinastri TaxID=1855383 RepID=UPI001EECEC99|nr:alanine racemase [Faunimonas pinastri]